MYWPLTVDDFLNHRRDSRALGRVARRRISSASRNCGHMRLVRACPERKIHPAFGQVDGFVPDGRRMNGSCISGLSRICSYGRFDCVTK